MCLEARTILVTDTKKSVCDETGYPVLGKVKESNKVALYILGLKLVPDSGGTFRSFIDIQLEFYGKINLV